MSFRFQPLCAQEQDVRGMTDKGQEGLEKGLSGRAAEEEGREWSAAVCKGRCLCLSERGVDAQT